MALVDKKHINNWSDQARQAIAYDVDATNNLLPPNYLHGFTFLTSKRFSNFFGIVARSFNARLGGYRSIVEHHRLSVYT